MFRRILISLITAGAAVGAAALVKKYTEKKENDSDDTPEKDDDSVNFINIDDDDDEDEEPVEESGKEDAPVDIPIMGAEKEEKPEAEKEAAPEEKQYSPEIEEVAGLYPYLSKDFIAEQFSRNDAFNEQYPEDTLITISHKASFPDADLLEEYTKIAEENGYTAEKTSETGNIIRRKMFTENGAILSDIYNVANQVACLKGTYEGYNIEE